MENSATSVDPVGVSLLRPYTMPWRWIVGFWGLVALIMTATRLTWWHLMSPFDGPRLTLSGRIAYQFIYYSVWALLTPILFRFSAWLLYARSWRMRIALSVVGAVTGAIGMGIIRSALHNLEHLGPSPHGLQWIVRDSLGRVHEDFMIFVAIVAVGLARHYYQQRELQRNKTLSIRGELAHARLHALQMQLNPHFLFNALNSISGLVSHDPRATRVIVARLSDLLRWSLAAAEAQEVSLAEEVSMAESYLDIMQIRFGERLRTTIAVDDAVLDSRVPAFLVQPLLENAFKHGLSKVDGVGHVSIRASRYGQQLWLEVADNGPDPCQQNDGEHEGIGLRNLRRRLRELYGAASSVELNRDGTGCTVVTVVFPHQLHSSDNHE